MKLRDPIPKEIKKEVYWLYNNECIECGEKEKKLLQIHHKDQNPENNDIDNLEIICLWCHALSKHPENAEHMIAWAIDKGIIE